jgi:MFS-type transporter involved in bile tolerance (Atg22 family)
VQKTIRLWYLYDFSNSFASIGLLFYYPLILSEQGASDAWVGIAASIATAILLLILPSLGAYSDRTGKRIFLIKISSAIMVASLIIMAFLLQQPGALETSSLIVVSVFYVLFHICFQSSFMFYSAMMRSISTPETRANISGVGLGLGLLGNALALGISGIVVGTSLLIIGLSGKPLTLFVGAALFAIISIPFFRQREIVISSSPVRFSYFKFLRKLLFERKAFLFLIGYSLLADAVLTFQLYIAVYTTKVFNFPEWMVVLAGITGLTFGIVGGLLANKLVQKVRNKEKALILSSLLYALCFGICALMPNIKIIVFIGLALASISYGLVFSLSRTVYSEIIPEQGQGEFFSIFTVFERAASIVGPLAWLLTFHLLQTYGENIQYRGSVFLLMIICLFGVYFLRKSARHGAV